MSDDLLDHHPVLNRSNQMPPKNSEPLDSEPLDSEPLDSELPDKKPSFDSFEDTVDPFKDSVDLFKDSTDPFKGTTNKAFDISFQSKIHLRIFKRNARKTITVIEGLDQRSEIDLKKFILYTKKKLSCNGSVKKNTLESGEVQELIQFQGDHRTEITNILHFRYNIKLSDIIQHGY